MEIRHMSMPVEQNNHSISLQTRVLISLRYKTITKAINREFWNSSSDTANSFYVGSYGRGTAVDTSDLDVLVELPNDQYDRFNSPYGNGPSRLLQTVKNAVLESYPRSDVKGDGQVVVINFSDGIKFEILPAFRKLSYIGTWDGTYKYPDTHMGGNWMSTNPKAEQKAMKEKNGFNESNGLLYDTCKHIRYIHNEHFSSYHLSGILIDSFVYKAIGNWHWDRDNYETGGSERGDYEWILLNYYNAISSMNAYVNPILYAPGSNMIVKGDDWDILGKVLNYIV